MPCLTIPCYFAGRACRTRQYMICPPHLPTDLFPNPANNHACWPSGQHRWLFRGPADGDASGVWCSFLLNFLQLISRPPYKPPPPTNRHPAKRVASTRVYLQNKFLKIQVLTNCNPSFYSTFLFIQWIDILKPISRMHLRI